jgi:two-component system, NtrC family, sensor kinase
MTSLPPDFETDLKEENDRLKRELREARDRQAGSAEVLRTIASVPGDAGRALQQVAETTARLFGASSVSLFIAGGNDWSRKIHVGAGSKRIGAEVPQDLLRIGGRNLPSSVVLENRQIHAPDLDNVDPAIADWPGIAPARAAGTRVIAGTPLRREGKAIGALIVHRDRPEPFTAEELSLQQSFADQAAIAIENARLLIETNEALEQQTATADILKVIASSPADVQPVFDAIATSSNRLIGGFSTAVLRFVDDELHLAAFTPTSPKADEALRSSFPRPLSEFPHFMLVRDGETQQFTDTESEDVSPLLRDLARLRGYRSMLFTPLMNNGKPIGMISVTRKEPGTFATHYVQLVRTFADQAVIAIENVRLFDEVQAKTRDLSESLQQQTATAEVLKVISRSPDRLQPVLDVIVETSRELCSALTAVIFLLRDGKFHDVAESAEKPDYIKAIRANPISLDQKGSIMARAAREKRTVHIPNSAEDPEAGLGGPLDSAGPRSLLSAPLILDGQVIGGITLQQSRLVPFTARQIEAIETFADQAVIAISNVNLFEQVQQRTRELSKSLDELRTAQDRLIQTEKLASLGQLTAGIAHEIKNPLNFVNNFAALSAELTGELNDLLKSASLAGETREEVGELTGLLKDNLDKVVQHGKRADSIVKNMLLHSREGSGEHRPADITALLEESLNLAYHGARAEKPHFNVTLQRNFDRTAGMVDVFPQEITRVFLNLISNSFYAVTKRKTEICNSAYEPIVSASTRDLGHAVEVRIRDNGTGIAADVKEKMFNPFFTTKPAGEGTGLGLSMSHDIIVKQHGGRIDVETEPGRFTEFIIVLPRTGISARNVER